MKRNDEKWKAVFRQLAQGKKITKGQVKKWTKEHETYTVTLPMEEAKLFFEELLKEDNSK